MQSREACQILYVIREVKTFPTKPNGDVGMVDCVSVNTYTHIYCSHEIMLAYEVCTLQTSYTKFLQTSFEVRLNFVRSRHKFGVKFMQSQLRQGSYKVSAKFVQSKDEVYTYVQVRQSFTMST